MGWALDIAANFWRMNKNLDSADFAMVMSTGIVSTALKLLGHDLSAIILFYINIALFLILWPLYLLKLFRYPARTLEDFSGHLSGPGFLTLVAGTNILGSQFVLFEQNYLLAEWLFWLGTICWIFMIWGIFYCIFTAENKPALENGINGAWLLATVSSQSIVILGLDVSQAAGFDGQWGVWLLCALFCLGIMLYIFVITAIFYRFCFAKMSAADMDPTYWINAGAVAISTLAGASLLLHQGASPLLDAWLPFIRGMTLLTWATASWWMPMLFLLGIWRHLLKRYGFSYAPAYWGMVFPLGMYTACTASFAQAMDFAGLAVISRFFIVFALAAWLATFAGMLQATGRTLLVAPERRKA